MRSNTYYGEYSLKHWLNLIVKRNIILPDYQRSFVWTQNDIERLIHSFRSGQFIQPVTIARMNSIGDGANIILDGQQRLTSVLLLALGYFPKKDRFKEADLTASDENEDSTETDMVPSNIIEWTFEKMLVSDIKRNTLSLMKNRISADERYEELHFKNATLLLTGTDLENFLDNTFLGFSYIVPEAASANEEQEFYSTLFRNMNYLGEKLSTLESRKSLYYLNDRYKNFFEGRLSDGSDALNGLEIMENAAPRRIDFVRYLSILSQYEDSNIRSKRVLVGYSSYSSRENFYVDYVSYILGLDQEDRSDKFNRFSMSRTFGDAGWEPRFERLKDTVERLRDNMGLDTKYPQAFKSWIDADYWLFGLIYWIVFRDKEINLDTNLPQVLAQEIRRKKKKQTDSYVKSPNMLGHLRNRLERSISIYQRHLI